MYVHASEGLWGEVYPTDLLKCSLFAATVQKLWFQCDFVRTPVKSVPGRWFECFGGGGIVTLTSPLGGQASLRHPLDKSNILFCGYIGLSRCQSGSKVSVGCTASVRTNGARLASFLPHSLSLVTQILVMLLSSPTPGVLLMTPPVPGYAEAGCGSVHISDCHHRFSFACITECGSNREVPPAGAFLLCVCMCVGLFSYKHIVHLFFFCMANNPQGVTSAF